MADKKTHKDHEDGEGHGHGATRYVVIWLALLFFTVTTVVTGRMDLGAANLPLAMTIAVIKAVLVILFFMHLWDSEGINRLVFSVSVVFVLVLLAGVFGDVLTRAPQTLPLQYPQASSGVAAHGDEVGHGPAANPGSPRRHHNAQPAH